MVIIKEMEIKHKKFQSSFEFQAFTYFLLIGLLVTFFVGYIGSAQAKAVRDLKSYYGTIVQLDDNSKIISDSSFYYVGNTRNYLFLYNEKEKKTSIIPMSKIKELTIHINRRK
jgi:hypothetical protein